MTHRADQILTAIAALVRARVGGKGVHVYTHRRFSLDPEQDEMPAISVDFGEDRAATETVSFLHSILEVPITAVVVGAEESDVREQLLQLRVEIHRAVLADEQLGLAFVDVAKYAGALDPPVDVDGDTPRGSLTSNWLVHYRMNRTDPGDA